MELARLRVGIIGAGVGGLAAALALSRRGSDVRVFERATERRREGIALLIWANAMQALARLGVYDAVRPRATSIEVTEVRNPRGELLNVLPIGEWSRAREVPTVAVRRPDLIEALANALGRDRVHTGASFARYEASVEQVVAHFDNGDEVELDVLVGADGLNSAVRAQLLGRAAPRPNHQHAWVGIAHGVRDLMQPGVTTVTVGRGPRFWSAPLDEDAAFWYATLHDPPATLDPVHVALGRAFEGWHVPIAELLARSHDDEIVHTQIFDRPPVDRWGAGPVTLLGDAAHPSTPDLGQGACQALESAVVLASALGRAPDAVSGLREYERLRMERTATISRLCWLTSLNATARNPAVCSLRDAVLRAGLRTIARGPLTWILAGQEC